MPLEQGMRQQLLVLHKPQRTAGQEVRCLVVGVLALQVLMQGSLCFWPLAMEL